MNTLFFNEKDIPATKHNINTKTAFIFRNFLILPNTEYVVNAELDVKTTGILFVQEKPFVLANFTLGNSN